MLPASAPLDIRSDFDSGNILVVDASDRHNVKLAIRPDSKSPHFQWFHFRVDHLVPGTAHRFELTNAGQSSYAHAWHGYNAVASYDGKEWFRIPSHYDGQALSFTVAPEHPSMWFAYFEPYSRQRHADLLVRAQAAGFASLAVGHSVEGREITLLRMGCGGPGRRKLWLIAQQHPGEHMAEWFMEGVVDYLSSGNAEVSALLAQADVHLVLNMNPDGAFNGHLRTNAHGQDLNRAWQQPSAELTPEVHFVKQTMAEQGVDLFIDVHGDEAIPHVFTAACEGNPGYTPRLAALEAQFRQLMCERTADFQTAHGYPRSQPGKANLNLACNAIGQRHDCLSLTLEMPFKDHDDAPNARTGWSAARSAQLGRDMLAVIGQMLGALRE